MEKLFTAEYTPEAEKQLFELDEVKNIENYKRRLKNDNK